MADVGPLAMKRCHSCGGEYLLAFFRHNSGDRRASPPKDERQLYRDRCIGCESMRQRSEELDQRLRRKAMETRRRHGKKLEELGVIKERDDLEAVYGWSLDQMVEDIKRVINEGCPYCALPVVSADGFGEITLDILNPDIRPHYVTNVRWCCSRCNSEKQRLSPDVWGARKTMWHQWLRNQTRRGSDPLAFGFLPLDQQEEGTLPLW